MVFNRLGFTIRDREHESTTTKPITVQRKWKKKEKDGSAALTELQPRKHVLIVKRRPDTNKNISEFSKCRHDGASFLPFP